MIAKPDTKSPIRDVFSAILLCAVLVIVGIASMTQLRWVSPAAQASTPMFGAGFDLTCATLLGTAIVIVAAMSYLVASPDKGRSRTLFAVELILVLGLIISTVASGDKRIAINIASGLVVGLILMHTTWRLVDRPWKLRLVVIVLVGLGTVFAMKTWQKERYEIDQTRKEYWQQREQLWAEQGKSLDDPMVKLFEARLESRDNGGFFFHGNLGGAYLATMLMVSLAGIGYRFYDPRGPFRRLWLVLQMILAAFIGSAVIITYSKGAVTAAVVGMVCAVLLLAFSSRFARHLNRTLIVVAVIGVCGFASVIGYGLVKHTLPTLSMAYRWQYWTASYAMFKDHPVTGVGAGNFGLYYMRYKLPAAEEEISSPHNFIVQGFTEFGLIGGTALLLWMIMLFYQIARRSTRPPTETASSLESHSAAPALPNLLWIAVALFAGVFVFSQINQYRPDYFLAEYLQYVLVFGVVFLIGAVRGNRLDQIENRPGRSGKLAEGGVTIWLAGALVTFIAGDLVNFSLFEPSTEFLFFFLAGLTLAAVGTIPGNRPNRMDFAKAGVLAILAGPYLLYVSIPSAQIEHVLAEAEHRPVLREDPTTDPIFQKLAKLSTLYPVDAHLPALAGQRLLDVSKNRSILATETAAEYYAEACRRADPGSQFWRERAECYLTLAALEPARCAAFLLQATTLYDEALARAPRSKSIWLRAGLANWTYAQALPATETDLSKTLIAKARKYLQTAIKLDRALPGNSLRRFSDSELAGIYQVLKQARITAPPPTEPIE